jgi:lysozyme family protein
MITVDGSGMIIPRNWQESVQHTTGVEGGYSNRASDRGGETIWGITHITANEPWAKRIWPKYNWNGDMRTMPKEMAYELYKVGWWDRLHLDAVAALSMPLAHRMFDFGVNAGRGNAASSLQRLLNLFNKGGKLYPDIPVDGGMGPQTIQTLHAYANAFKNTPAAIEKLTLLMFSAQNWHYVLITEKDVVQEDNFNGWTNRTWNDFYQYAKWLTP